MTRQEAMSEYLRRLATAQGLAEKHNLDDAVDLFEDAERFYAENLKGREKEFELPDGAEDGNALNLEVFI